MSKRRLHLHRRIFLRGAGGVALGLPLLNMFESTVRAEAGVSDDGFPLRFVVIFTPNGVVPETWWPQGTPTEQNWELNSSLEPLAPYKDQLLMLDGINMPAAHRDAGPGEPHQRGMGVVLTGRPLQEGDMVGGNGETAGWADGISIDQAIAAQIGSTTPFGSLELGVRADHVGGSEVRNRFSYAGPAQPLSPVIDPVQTWSLLFSELNMDPSEMARLRQRRVSVLDAVHEQFAALETKAGSEDRIRLEQHAALVSELQTRIDSVPVLGESCEPPLGPDSMDPNSEDTMQQVSELQIDMLTMALACDLTRVATLQFSNSRNHVRFPWLGSGSDGHYISHAWNSDPSAANEVSVRRRWYAGQLARLLGRLQEVPEGDGTMLDHTVVLWVSEIAHGDHSHDRMPFVMAGNLAGHFRTGRYLDFGGQSHNDLLVSLQNAFGIDSQTFGASQFCTGPLVGLTV